MACQLFVEEHGIIILQQNLLGNFILHLVNLYDFGLIKPEVVYRSMMFLYKLRERLEENQHLAPVPSLTAESLSDVHKLKHLIKTQSKLRKLLMSMDAPRSSSSSSQPTTSSSSSSSSSVPASSHSMNNGTS